MLQPSSTFGGFGREKNSGNMRSPLLAVVVLCAMVQYTHGWQCTCTALKSDSTRRRCAAAVDSMTNEAGTSKAKRAWLALKDGKEARQQTAPELAGKVTPVVMTDQALKGIMSHERCNVVLTHVNADFDSLAGAVALAKLWSIERPEQRTYVVMPRGVNPLVARFLAYHKHILPVRGFKTIKKEDVVAVGIVDTQSAERLGPAAAWLESAEHVTIADHHTHAESDINADERIVEPVGSATTVLVERLQRLAESGEPAAALTQTEATLCALGIRTDTGALSFPATTPRDAYALAWLMSQGCSQSAIAEFGAARLTAEQRSLLSSAMDDVSLTTHEGLKVGHVVLDTGRGFVTGMAAVCEDLLTLLSADVVLLGVLSANAKGKAQVAPPPSPPVAETRA